MASSQPVSRASAKGTLLPILVVLLALGLFGTMDGVMKAASLRLGAYGSMFWRSLISSVVLAPLMFRAQSGGKARPGRLSRASLALHARRAAVCMVMAVLFFHGLTMMPLAEAMALSFIAPLIALFLVGLLLGETISRRAVAGSVLALLGVGVIASGQLGAGAAHGGLTALLFVLASAVLYAWNLILQRQQAQMASPLEIAFFQAGFGGLFLAPGAFFLARVPVPEEWVLLAGAAVLSTTSIALLGWAYARAEAQVLVPLEYTAFIWAALVGWLAFAEPLGWRTVAGVVAIVAGCLWATWTRPVPGDGVPSAGV